MDTANDKPVILHVDDEPTDLDSWKATIESSTGARLILRHPDEIKPSDLHDADLVLVDYKLDSWPARDGLTALSLKPANGLALLTILQEHNHELISQRPAAFALYTAVIDDVARGLVPQEHIVARAHNLEWVFRKTVGNFEENAARVYELARAVQALPSDWPGETAEGADQALWKWLALPTDELWSDDAQRDVRQCHPPAHEFAEHTHGIAILRWFLHRILPYPCFLLDEKHLASRMRVKPSSLHLALEEDGPLRRHFAASEYHGQLSNFLGRRWWKSGVETAIFELVKENPGNIGLLRERVKALDPRLETYSAPMVVPVLDRNYETSDDLVPIDDVIQVRPDDWPPYAEQAWTTSSLADEDAILCAIVLSDS